MRWGLEWFNVAQVLDQWGVLSITVMKPLVTQNAGNESTVFSKCQIIKKLSALLGLFDA
jgi:hypothetical protein